MKFALFAILILSVFAEDALFTHDQVDSGIGALHQTVFYVWGTILDIGDTISNSILGKAVGAKLSEVSTLSPDPEVTTKFLNLKRGEVWLWRHEGDKMQFWNPGFWFDGIRNGILGKLWSRMYIKASVPDRDPKVSLQKYIYLTVGRIDKKGNCISANKTTLALSTWHHFWNHDYLGFTFSPFRAKCAKIEAYSDVKVNVEVTIGRHITFPIFLIGGTILFFIAPILAGSVACCMLAAGVAGSLLVAFCICFIIYRHFLKDQGIVGTAIFALPVSITLYAFWEFMTFQTVSEMMTYYWWVWYLMAGGFLIAAIYVYINPPSERAQDVISVSLRIAGLYMIGHSTSSHAVSLFLAVIVGVVGTVIVFATKSE